MLLVSRNQPDQGARVTAHYNTNSTALDPLCEIYESTKLRKAQASLGREDDVIRLFSAAKPDEGGSNFGPVQVVIVNHGVWPATDVPLAEMTLEQWKSTLDTNLTSSFLVVREYLKQLQASSEALKEKAAVILVGGTSGKFGEADHADFAASKSGT